MREFSKDKLRSFGNGQARYLTQDIAARTVPPHQLAVNMLDPAKGMVALGVSCIDGRPWWKDEHRRVEWVRSK